MILHANLRHEIFLCQPGRSTSLDVRTAQRGERKEEWDWEEEEEGEEEDEERGNKISHLLRK